MMLAGPAGLSDDEDYYDSEGYEFDDNQFSEGSTESGYGEPVLETPATVAQLLEAAMKNGELLRVEELVSTIDDYLNFELDSKLKPLMYAAHLGNPDLLELFLEYEQEIGISINRSLLPAPLTLTCSILNENNKLDLYRCVELMLDYGANPNHKDNYGVSALMMACKNSSSEIVKLLLERSAIVNDRDNEGWSPLFYAVNRGDEAIIQLLLSAGAELNKMDKRNRLAYMLANERNFSKLVEVLKPEEIKDEERRAMHDLNLKNSVEKCNVLMDKKPEYFIEVYTMVCGSGIGMDRYAVSFLENKVTLRDFLLLKDQQQLIDMGINFTWHRQILLHKIKQFHVSKWMKTSIGLSEITEKKNDFDNMKNALMYLATLHRQIYVIRTTIKYIEDELKKYPEESWKKSVEKMHPELKFIVHVAEMLKETIKEIKLQAAPHLLAQEIR